MKKNFFWIVFVIYSLQATSQSIKLSPRPPMGWMSWNLMQETINEKDVKEMADAMIANGMVAAGYQYMFIDDCWQGGRDRQNNIIPDPKKFPSGIKALADYLHARNMKLGIYSDAAPLTCAGYTGSLHFEQQDAETFASWGIDFLKYDYCGAPEDVETAKARYKTMADALRKSGRDIVFSICEWGPRKPWLWGAEAGGQLWRTTYDIRDKWKKTSNQVNTDGILDVMDINAALHDYSGPGKWNDADMLVVGLYGLKGPSAHSAGKGCTDAEYQSQFSLWAIMNSPLYASCDLRTMNETTKRILLNAEVIALNQDSLGKQAVRVINNATWSVFVKPLANNDYAIAVLNRSDSLQAATIIFQELGLTGNYEIRDLWEHTKKGAGKTWKGQVNIHETKVFRLTPIAH
ncbi:MAG: glycoside hydrolase family 27 protein [Bacteroidota bacterium]